MIERWGTPPEVIDVPLAESSVDLGRVDRFLRSARAPAGAMLLSQLDGFLTGIAVGPEFVTPSEWMPLVWGEEEPVFDSFEEMQTVFGTVLARYTEIVLSLQQDPPEFEPIFGKSESGEWIAAGWASGFIDAIALRGPAWMPLIRSKEGKLLLLPILLSLPDDAVTGIDDLEFFRDPTIRTLATEFIPDAIVEIDLFWRRRPQKTPRNARCPCGSGRKYKYCCGR